MDLNSQNHTNVARAFGAIGLRHASSTHEPAESNKDRSHGGQASSEIETQFTSILPLGKFILWRMEEQAYQASVALFILGSWKWINSAISFFFVVFSIFSALVACSLIIKYRDAADALERSRVEISLADYGSQTTNAASCVGEVELLQTLTWRIELFRLFFVSAFFCFTSASVYSCRLVCQNFAKRVIFCSEDSQEGRKRSNHQTNSPTNGGSSLRHQHVHSSCDHQNTFAASRYHRLCLGLKCIGLYSIWLAFLCCAISNGLPGRIVRKTSPSSQMLAIQFVRGSSIISEERVCPMGTLDLATRRDLKVPDPHRMGMSTVYPVWPEGQSNLLHSSELSAVLQLGALVGAWRQYLFTMSGFLWIFFIPDARMSILVCPLAGLGVPVAENIIGSVLVEAKVFQNHGYLLFSFTAFVFSVFSLALLVSLLGSHILLRNEEEIHSQARRRLLRWAFHEVRVPAAAILGGIDLLLEDTSDLPSSETKNTLYDVAAASKQLKTILDNTLEWQRMDKIGMTIATSTFHLHTWAKETVSMFTPISRVHNINLRLHFAPIKNDVLVTADVQKLSHVLTNLLSNALKYAKNQCTVSVHLFAFRTKCDPSNFASLRKGDHTLPSNSSSSSSTLPEFLLEAPTTDELMQDGCTEDELKADLFEFRGSILGDCDQVDGIVFVKIHDDGNGMSKSSMQGYTSEFSLPETSAYSEANVRNHGSGLGAHIAAKMLSKLQGKLFLRSREGHGTIATFAVPIRVHRTQNICSGSNGLPSIASNDRISSKNIDPETAVFNNSPSFGAHSQQNGIPDVFSLADPKVLKDFLCTNWLSANLSSGRIGKSGMIDNDVGPPGCAQPCAVTNHPQQTESSRESAANLAVLTSLPGVTVHNEDVSITDCRSSTDCIMPIARPFSRLVDEQPQTVGPNFSGAKEPKIESQESDHTTAGLRQHLPLSTKLPLPVNDVHHSQATGLSGSHGGSDSNGHLSILVVEDEVTVSRVLCRVLSRKLPVANQISTANNGQECLDMISNVYKLHSGHVIPANATHLSGNVQQGSDIAKFDVIIMDMMMPCMNGIDATQAVTKWSRNGLLGKSPPVIVGLTGNSLEEDIQRFIDAGAIAALPKPLKMHQLIDVLKAHGIIFQ